jgi:hypothetical protein
MHGESVASKRATAARPGAIKVELEATCLTRHGIAGRVLTAAAVIAPPSPCGEQRSTGGAAKRSRLKAVLMVLGVELIPAFCKQASFRSRIRQYDAQQCVRIYEVRATCH